MKKLLILFFLLGCSSGGGPAAPAEDTPLNGDTSFGEVAPGQDTATPGVDTTPGADTEPELVEATCEAPQPLDSQEAFAEVIAEMTWGNKGPYTSAHLPVSGDYVVTGPLTLSAVDLPVPGPCIGAPDCRDLVTFLMPENPIPGVEALDRDESVAFLKDYQKVQVTNAAIRFRPLLYDTHPEEFNWVPVIQLLADCETPCAPKFQKCPYDKVCYRTTGSSDYCRLCLAKDKQECACWTPDGPKDDGEGCFFMVSGDVMCGGTCADGICESTESGAGCP